MSKLQARVDALEREKRAMADALTAAGDAIARHIEGCERLDFEVDAKIDALTLATGAIAKSAHTLGKRAGAGAQWQQELDLVEHERLTLQRDLDKANEQTGALRSRVSELEASLAEAREEREREAMAAASASGPCLLM